MWLSTPQNQDSYLVFFVNGVYDASMNDEDLKKFRKVVQEEIKVVREEIGAVRKEIRTEITASERRILKVMSEGFNGVGEFMENSIFPELEKKADKSDIDRLETKLDKNSARLDSIESIPVIAHELKIRSKIN